MIDPLSQYYRSPRPRVQFRSRDCASGPKGYFRFGQNALCYGPFSRTQVAVSNASLLADALLDVSSSADTIQLPFDPSQVADNLRQEIYADDRRSSVVVACMAKLYYFIRPCLWVNLRRRLQKLHFSGWEKIQFPRWPVDCSVDELHKELMLLQLRASGMDRIPFIWFWPDGARSCVIMTHDVETRTGRDFCGQLMDCNDRFRMKASFQIIPEERYSVEQAFLDSIRDRGFEIVVHDLNHDGHLFKDRSIFLERVAKINAYGKAFGAKGFRAGVLYRRQSWFDSLDFSYDMSVPNVAHLDPQRGGCCTVMPYSVGHLTELPVTTTQDYTLFHIMSDYSIDLWKRQIKQIMANHGLISFIVHPDYVVGKREMAVYESLLECLNAWRDEGALWAPTPGEVDDWWRKRAKMDLVQTADGWSIVGPGCARARVAFAREEAGQLVYELAGTTGQIGPSVAPR
jgi:peptidoglycan/xylan/chitin deacetylase (PgdA/CDA1 family)